MPKLRKVKITENSMSWEDFKIENHLRKLMTSVPKREFESFLSKGMKPKRVIIEF